MAYPPVSTLDDDLRSLIRDPKTCLSAISATDVEAAKMLQFYFSGYATLRRFYEIRDEELRLEKGQKPKYRPLARKRAAAEALVAVIRSASDSIYGGLYDQDRDSAIQVDGLLALLGEALVFIDSKFIHHSDKALYVPILTTLHRTNSPNGRPTIYPSLRY